MKLTPQIFRKSASVLLPGRALEVLGGSWHRALQRLRQLERGDSGEPLNMSGGGNYRRGAVLFSALVILPTIIYLLYSALFESVGYVSETRLTVQAAEKQKAAISAASSFIGRIFGAASMNTGRDGFVVLNYIKSSAIINDIGGREYLEKVYSGSNIDYFSRLKRDKPIEDLLEYWLEHIQASVDTISGIIIVKAKAYSPQEARQIAADIGRLSEKLVNEISMRSRQDALTSATREVQRSAAELSKAREKLLLFRTSNRIIDPTLRATSLGETMAKLTLERIEAQTALDVLVKSAGGDDSPTRRILNAKIDTLNQQIAALEGQLTSRNQDGTVSQQIGEYELLKLEEMFSERLYVIAQDAYLRAEQDLRKQQLYLATVVPAYLPEIGTYPKVFNSTLLLFVSLSILWAIGALLAASIRDQME